MVARLKRTGFEYLQGILFYPPRSSIVRKIGYTFMALIILWSTCEASWASNETDKPIIHELDPKQRAFVLLTLLTLILLGFLFILFVIVGGRWVRRQARWQRGPKFFGGSAGYKDPKDDRIRSPLSNGSDHDSISMAETQIDIRNEDTQQSNK